MEKVSCYFFCTRCVFYRYSAIIALVYLLNYTEKEYITENSRHDTQHPACHQRKRVSLNTDRTTAHDRTAFTIARRPTADCSRPFHLPTARPHVVNDPIIANYPTTHSNDISTHGPTVITIIAFYKRRANENTSLSPREVFT